MLLVLYPMAFYTFDIVLIRLLTNFPPGNWVSPTGLVLPPHFPVMQREVGNHSLPEEVNDEPRVKRRRIRGKTPIHDVFGRGASPPPKRRKWLSLPGPQGGYQESSYFPRVGVG